MKYNILYEKYPSNSVVMIFGDTAGIEFATILTFATAVLVFFYVTILFKINDLFNQFIII